MTLCEFLDEVRFGAVGTLCVAIRGEEEYLDNFEAGMYWRLDAGNWHEGSESPARPEIPEEIMEAEVTQVETAPDIGQMFAHLGWNMCNSYHFTVVLVEEPSDFDAEKYWSDKIGVDLLQEPCGRIPSAKNDGTNLEKCVPRVMTLEMPLKH